jgi:hypothetical protein
MNLIPAPISEDDIARYPHYRYAERCWVTDDGLFEILLNKVGELQHLKIHRIDDSKIDDFYIFQEIKNLVFGEDIVAVQVFLKQCDLKDGSNTYHLWTWEYITVPNLALIEKYH